MLFRLCCCGVFSWCILLNLSAGRERGCRLRSTDSGSQKADLTWSPTHCRTRLWLPTLCWNTSRDSELVTSRGRMPSVGSSSRSQLWCKEFWGPRPVSLCLLPKPRSRHGGHGGRVCPLFHALGLQVSPVPSAISCFPPTWFPSPLAC